LFRFASPRLLIPVLFAAGAYLAVSILLHLFADRLMFRPPRRNQHPASDYAMLTTRDGVRIAALHLPNPAAEFTILYSHGNAEDLPWIQFVLEMLRDAGFAVVAYDYRGYGASEGRPSAAGAVLDIEAAYAYVTGELGVPPDRVILHGRSIGAGPTLELAARERVAGVILESTFTSAFRTVTRVRLFPFDRFPNIDRIRQVDAPVLVIHGRSDGLVPFGHGVALFEAAPGPKRSFWVEQAGHNDLLTVAGAQYGEALREFETLLRDEAERS